MKEVEIANLKTEASIEIGKKDAEIASLKEKLDRQPTYSAITATPGVHTQPKQITSSQPRQTSCITSPSFTLKVYPKQNPSQPNINNSSEATRNYINNKIEMKGTNIRLTGVQKTKNNGVIYKCGTQDEIQQLDHLIKNSNCEVETEIETKKKPTFSMFVLDHEECKNVVKKEIIDKNIFLTPNDIEIVHLKQLENKGTIIFFEVTPQAYHKIVHRGLELWYTWRHYTLKERNNPTQCFQCQRFGHKASECKINNTKRPRNTDRSILARCPSCAGEWSCKFGNCVSPNVIRCSNCVEFNSYAKDRRQAERPINHTATSNHCLTKTRSIERIRQTIGYGY